MYDMYPSGAPYTPSENPFSERGASGLGHPECYPITVPVRTVERPASSRQAVAEAAGQVTAAVAEVTEATER